MVHDGPLGWGGDLTLRLSHFASFEVSYRITFCFWAGVGEGCGLGPHSGLGFKTSCQYSCLENPMERGAWWASVHGVSKSQTRLSDFTFTFHFHALQKEMATHSSVLAWRIPGTEEPGGLPSLGSHRVGHDWSDLAAVAVTELTDAWVFSVQILLCFLSQFIEWELASEEVLEMFPLGQVILVLQFDVLPERTMSVAWERVVKHEWKLLETHLYQRF